MVATRTTKGKSKQRGAVAERRISSRIKDNVVKHESDAAFAALVRQQQQQEAYTASVQANEPPVELTDAEIEASLPHADVLEGDVKAALVVLRRQTLQPELLRPKPFELPFTAEEIKSIGGRKAVRKPSSFRHISKSVYLTSTKPVADLPVHTCDCYEEKKASGSTTRRGKAHEELVPETPKKCGRRSEKENAASAAAVVPEEQELYCGESCHNRMLLISCSADTCSAPEHLCTNRAIKRRENKAVRVAYVEGCGFGLFAKEVIEQGEFVIEYVGEVIDDHECEKRLIRDRDQGESHFYMLEIEKDVVVDARHRSNEARFINHSCDSNCMTQKWNVDGFRRIGIFARRRVLPGEEITIDYNFSHFGDPMDCRCGSVSCTGKLGLKRSDVQMKNALQKINASKKSQEIFASLPPEVKRPVHLTSLALLKSSKLEMEWLNFYGYSKRRLFIGNTRQTPVKKTSSTTEPPGHDNAASASTSSSSSPLSSEWSATTEEDVSSEPKELEQGDWYDKFKTGAHLEAMGRMHSYLCGGVHNWEKDIQEAMAAKKKSDLKETKKRKNAKTATPQPPARSATKLARKRLSLLDARARFFADLVTFANGKSKWNTRVPSSEFIVSDHIYRFIDNMKNGKQISNHDAQNDLNEDACHRCKLTGQLICCDGCPAAFHLNCTNLAVMPPADTHWFCELCIRRMRLRAQGDGADDASASSRGRALRHSNNAAPVAPLLKRILHAPATTDKAAKRRPRKKMKLADKSYRMLEQMALPMWDEDDE